jgi:hypothetical protein
MIAESERSFPGCYEKTFQFIFWRVVGFALKGEHAPCTSRLRGPSTCPLGCRESLIEPSLKEAARKRSCDSMTDSSSCASSSSRLLRWGCSCGRCGFGAPPPLRARSRSTRVYCRGSAAYVSCAVPSSIIPAGSRQLNNGALREPSRANLGGAWS